MSRKDLADTVASATGITSAQAQDAITAALDSIIESVAKGDKVTLSGFGTFERRHRAARSGRNPQTGEALEIAASESPAFKPAAGFKNAVSGK